MKFEARILEVGTKSAAFLLMIGGVGFEDLLFRLTIVLAINFGYCFFVFVFGVITRAATPDCIWKNKTIFGL